MIFPPYELFANNLHGFQLDLTREILENELPKLEISDFGEMNLLEDFHGRHLSPGCWTVTGKPGFVLFRLSRYILQKISSKNNKFQESYSLFTKVKKRSKKSFF